MTKEEIVKKINAELKVKSICLYITDSYACPFFAFDLFERTELNEYRCVGIIRSTENFKEWEYEGIKYNTLDEVINYIITERVVNG